MKYPRMMALQGWLVIFVPWKNHWQAMGCMCFADFCSASPSRVVEFSQRSCICWDPSSESIIRRGTSAMAKLMFVLATPSGYISDGEITILVSYPMAMYLITPFLCHCCCWMPPFKFIICVSWNSPILLFVIASATLNMPILSRWRDN